MKAIALEAFGGNDRLKLMELPIPEPTPSQILVEIKYAAANPVDVQIRKGMMKRVLPYRFPMILGWDMSGVVVSAGQNVSHFQVGDEVYAYCRKRTLQSGTFAQFIALDPHVVSRKPTNLSFAQAASIPLAALTAWQSMFDFAKLKKGDAILIHAGAGGVGSFAIQLAKWAGAKVFTTASQKNHAYVRSLGADVAIDYTKEKFGNVLRDLAPQGLDVVFDTVGGATLKESLPLVKEGACLVSIVDPQVAHLAKGYPMDAGFILVSPNGAELKEITKLFEGGQLKPPTLEEFPLEKAAMALEKLEAGHTQGKIVLRIS